MKKRHQTRLKIYALFISMLFLQQCVFAVENADKKRVVTIGNAQVFVEIADTFEERTVGLQKRTSLDSDSGMLFIYENEKYLNFWMKDTAVPLDLAYIDAKGRIVEILYMIPYDLTVKRSREKVKFVLEVNQGWFKEHNVSVGDTISNISDYITQKNKY